MTTNDNFYKYGLTSQGRQRVDAIDRIFQRLIDEEKARSRRQWIGASEIADIELAERALDDNRENRLGIFSEITGAFEDSAFETGAHMAVIWLPRASVMVRLLDRPELRMPRRRFVALERCHGRASFYARQQFMEDVVGHLAFRIDAYRRWRRERGLTDQLPPPFGDDPAVEGSPAMPVAALRPQDVDEGAPAPAVAEAAAVAALPEHAEHTDVATAETRETPTDTVLDEWYLARVEKCLKHGEQPSRRDDWQAANKDLGRVSQTRIEAVRANLAPREWTTHGRRTKN
jgi:hypothetical protein